MGGMARYPITRLKADGFGPLDMVDIEFSPGLNIVTGDNATGKSQLLKLLYAGSRTLHRSQTPTKSGLASRVAEALVGVFRPDQLGRLTRRGQGRTRTTVELTYQGMAPLDFSFASNARTDVNIRSFPNSKLDDIPVFLPSRELLSLYPGLVALFDSREVEFDETWRDTALLLGRAALKGRRGTHARTLLAPLFEEIEGSVVEENGRFYVQLPTGGTGAGRIEAHLVSEGFRKLAMIIRLVTNGVLLDGGYLFWDEPEANLNPRTQQSVAKAIVTMADTGTQVFVATHSVFLLRELELLLEGSPTKARYIGLYRRACDDTAVRAESATDPADLSVIAALKAESAQSLRYLAA